MLPFKPQSFTEPVILVVNFTISPHRALALVWGHQELLSDGLQGYETDVLLTNCEAAKCSELRWCLPPRNNKKALKLKSAHVPLAPTSSLQDRGPLVGGGAVVENIMGNLHVS